jgi:CRP/FNR family cyclic AMP-dependent transcriptional regulator
MPDEPQASAGSQMISHPNVLSKWSIEGQALERFLAHCVISHRPKHFVLCRPGDPSGSLLYLVEGTAAVLALEDGGGELLLDHVHAGDFMGEIGLFKPTGRREVMIRAKTEVVLAEVSCQKLLDDMTGSLAADAPALLYTIGAQLSDRLLSTRRKAGGLALLDVSSRIQRALLDMCKEDLAIETADGCLVRISRRELSHRVGCSREVAGRMIKRLAEREFLEDRGRVLLIHRASMAGSS